MSNTLSAWPYYMQTRDFFFLIADKVVTGVVVVVLGLLVNLYLERRKSVLARRTAMALKRAEKVGEFQSRIDRLNRRFIGVWGSLKSLTWIAEDSHRRKGDLARVWSGAIQWDDLDPTLRQTVERIIEDHRAFLKGFELECRALQKEIDDTAFWLGPKKTRELATDVQVLADCVGDQFRYILAAPGQRIDLIRLDLFHDHVTRLHERGMSVDLRLTLLRYRAWLWWKRRRLSAAGKDADSAVR